MAILSQLQIGKIATKSKTISKSHFLEDEEKKWLAPACSTSKPNSSLNYTEKCPAAINHSCLKISIYYKTKLFFFQSFPFGGFFYGRHHISKENEGKIDWYARAAAVYVILKEEKPDPPRAP